MNSGPWSTTRLFGSPRASASASSTAMTVAAGNDVSTSISGHSRVNSSTIVRHRKRRRSTRSAVVESFFATLTKELLIDGLFTTRAEASREVFEFIEIWYNRQRRHSTLGYRTPAEYEATLAQIS